MASLETQEQSMGAKKDETTGNAIGEGKVGILGYILTALTH